ncbi:hypothetical protein C8J57DRAFT_1614162 [Mycena rebaudengoi]|nr:hypothetical protein C8J57DRAFT_1614162 [Mycena rebaudengoi]
MAGVQDPETSGLLGVENNPTQTRCAPQKEWSNERRAKNPTVNLYGWTPSRTGTFGLLPTGRNDNKNPMRTGAKKNEEEQEDPRFHCYSDEEFEMVRQSSRHSPDDQSRLSSTTLHKNTLYCSLSLTDASTMTLLQLGYWCWLIRISRTGIPRFSCITASPSLLPVSLLPRLPCRTTTAFTDGMNNLDSALSLTLVAEFTHRTYDVRISARANNKARIAPGRRIFLRQRAPRPPSSLVFPHSPVRSAPPQRSPCPPRPLPSPRLPRTRYTTSELYPPARVTRRAFNLLAQSYRHANHNTPRPCRLIHAAAPPPPQRRLWISKNAARPDARSLSMHWYPRSETFAASWRITTARTRLIILLSLLRCIPAPGDFATLLSSHACTHRARAMKGAVVAVARAGGACGARCPIRRRRESLRCVRPHHHDAGVQLGRTAPAAASLIPLSLYARLCCIRTRGMLLRHAFVVPPTHAVEGAMVSRVGWGVHTASAASFSSSRPPPALWGPSLWSSVGVHPVRRRRRRAPHPHKPCISTGYMHEKNEESYRPSAYK